MKPYQTDHFKVGISDPKPNPRDKTHDLYITVDGIGSAFNLKFTVGVPDTVPRRNAYKDALAQLGKVMKLVDEEVVSAEDSDDS